MRCDFFGKASSWILLDGSRLYLKIGTMKRRLMRDLPLDCAWPLWMYPWTFILGIYW